MHLELTGKTKQPPYLKLQPQKTVWKRQQTLEMSPPKSHKSVSRIHMGRVSSQGGGRGELGARGSGGSGIQLEKFPESDEWPMTASPAVRCDKLGDREC